MIGTRTKLCPVPRYPESNAARGTTLPKEIIRPSVYTKKAIRLIEADCHQPKPRPYPQLPRVPGDSGYPVVNLHTGPGEN